VAPEREEKEPTELLVKVLQRKGDRILVVDEDNQKTYVLTELEF
jgi:hypothetical protein